MTRTRHDLKSPCRHALVLLLCAAPPSSAEAAVKKMFLTSVSGTSQLSTWAEAQPQVGLAAGDAICRKLAQNAALPNFSIYRAWLSTDTDDAYCRVAGFAGKKNANCGLGTLPAAGPWQRIDGAPFARSLAALTGDLAVLHPAIITQTGTAFWGASLVHTGTSTDGTAYAAGNCNGWVAVAGDGRTGILHDSGTWWTTASDYTCGGFFARLYCFEPGAGDPLPEFEHPGALAFATSVQGNGKLGDWPDAGAATGLAAGDAICRSRAAAAGLPSPQSFVAWLSTSGVDAIDRLTTNGPFKRVDGVELSSTKSGLVDPGLGQYALETTMGVDENGDYIGLSAWTGSTSLGEHAPETCGGWTSNLVGDHGQRGSVQDIRSLWTSSTSAIPCNSNQRLYCFSNVITIFWDGFEFHDRSRWSASVP